MSYLEGRCATIDAMLRLVRLYEARGWDLRQPGVGGRHMFHKTMYVVGGDFCRRPGGRPRGGGGRREGRRDAGSGNASLGGRARERYLALWAHENRLLVEDVDRKIDGSRA